MKERTKWLIIRNMVIIDMFSLLIISNNFNWFLTMAIASLSFFFLIALEKNYNIKDMPKGEEKENE